MRYEQARLDALNGLSDHVGKELVEGPPPAPALGHSSIVDLGCDGSDTSPRPRAAVDPLDNRADVRAPAVGCLQLRRRIFTF